MELHKIQIKNFRSINDLTIFMTPRCRVLVGINESGKTNILRALSMLSSDQIPTNEDRRDPLPEEQPITEAYIRAVFKLDKTEQRQIFEKIKGKCLTKNINNILMTGNKKRLTLKEFCDTKNEGLYIINILDKKKSTAYWGLSENTYKIIDCWKKVSDECPSSYAIAGVSDITLNSFKLVNIDDYPDIPHEYLTDLSPADINELVGSGIIEIVEHKLPDCIFWIYNESNLLPGKIDLAGFMNNPSACLPLKHMFELADIYEIKSTIIEEQKRPNGLRNLLNRVANRTTKHIRNVWKEYKDFKIVLSENGSYIDAAIEDKFNLYNFSRRSDGFKRFITFLLMISVKERTKQLNNTILLIDEPDIGLHPSGARYLRDELMKIAGSNYVVYSTHSIFMIDRENIERHLIVKKENEVTHTEDVNQSNIKDEEVIFNALGYSIFENLQKKNIIFEGWRDKKLFKAAIKSPPLKFKSLKELFKDVGCCHAEGAKDIPRVTTILELADRNCIVLSDDDNVAKQHQKEYNGHGKWLRYSEILQNTGAVTGEDFVKPDAVIEALRDVAQKYPTLTKLSEKQLCDTKGKIYVLNFWLKQGGIKEQESKIVINQIKETVFNNLKSSQVEEKYYELLEQLANKL